MDGVRLDRAISIYVTHPLRRAFVRSRQAGIPILMYHGIRERIDGRHHYYETTTSPTVFAQQMTLLRDEGYRVIRLEDATNLLAAGMPPDKYAVITFDDGYRDVYTTAFPILQENRFTAAVFLPTGRIGNQTVSVDGNGYMTWNEVRELHAHGVQIGSHTVTHPELDRLKASEMEYEIRESKRAIEDKIGDSVGSFSYPFAFPEAKRGFARRLADLLESNGYENGVSTIVGTAGSLSCRFFLPRLPVNTWDDTAFLSAKLEGDYDWLHVPQLLTKAIKGLGCASLVPTDTCRANVK